MADVKKILHVIIRMLGAVTIPLRKNLVFFVMMYLLGTVCTFAVLPDRRGAHVFDFWWHELFVDVYILCAILSLLPVRLRRWARRVFYAIAYTVAVVDVYCFVKFDSTLTPTMLLLAGETTGSEAAEFLRSYIQPSVVFSRLGWVLLVMAAHFALAVTLFLCKEKKNVALCRFENYWARAAASRRPVYYLYPILSLSLISLFVYTLSSCLDNKRAEYRLMTYGSIGDIEHELTEKTCANMYQPLYRLVFSIHANRIASQQVARLIGGIDKASVDSCSFTSPNIVLVIGESYNRHHSQLYGYGKETTPRQVERERRGELIKMEDAVSPWNLTSYVFKHLFSMYAVGDAGDWCDYPLFPELFRRAGYHVTFITNQFLPKAKEAVYDFSGGFFLNNETLSRAMFDTRNTQLHDYDGGVLSEYDKLGKAGGEHRLIILHLMGQHVKYASRVPGQAEAFPQGRLSAQGLLEERAAGDGRLRQRRAVQRLDNGRDTQAFRERGCDSYICPRPRRGVLWRRRAFLRAHAQHRNHRTARQRGVRHTDVVLVLCQLPPCSSGSREGNCRRCEEAVYDRCLAAFAPTPGRNPHPVVSSQSRCVERGV